MSIDYVLTPNNLLVYAARHYYNPLGADDEEFIEDLNRFKRIKNLTTRYLKGRKLAHQLMMNHLITVFNVFDIEGGVEILKLHLDDEALGVVKPFLIYLKIIRNDQLTNLEMDKNVVEILRNLR